MVRKLAEFVEKFVKIAKAKGFSPPEPIMYDHNVYTEILSR
jgi:hypothetical protein